MRAIAILVAEETMNSAAENITLFIKEKLKASLQRAEETTDTLREATYDMTRAMDITAEMLELTAHKGQEMNLNTNMGMAELTH